MFLLAGIERCEMKLRVMGFIHNFDETLKTIGPQINSLIAASNALLSSKRLKQLFEVILGNYFFFLTKKKRILLKLTKWKILSIAFGNYLNSAKRGGAFGFKLNALDKVNFFLESFLM